MQTVLVRAAVSAAALVAAAAGAHAAFPQGVSSGDVTRSSAVLWARSTVAGPVTFEWSTDPLFGVISGSGVVTVTDTQVPAKLLANALTPGTQYFYRVTDADGSASGRFRTIQPAESRRGLRFGVSGDWRGELSPYPAVKNVPARDLDFFIKLGDTIYADYPSPAVPLTQCVTLNDFQTKHAEVYSTRFGLAAWPDLHASTPIYSMIDDHEVTNDFSGGAPISSDPRFGSGAGLINTSTLFQTGLQAFAQYNAINEETWNTPLNPVTDGQRRLYRSRQFGVDAAFHMADARSFRDQEIPDVSNPLDPTQVQNFLIAAFTPGRTMLGRPQLDALKADLLAARDAGVTWQFVIIGEPTQNLGVLNAGDRYEGYAAERTELLRFIRDNDVRNVVFVAADIHSSLVNNLTYQLGPGQPQITTRAFEITTGPVAFDAPFGPTVAGLAALLGVPGALPLNVYLALPAAQKEAYIQGLVNAQITPLGYDPLGLQGSPIRATLLTGGYTATNSFGWTEFEISPVTRELVVTVWGIPNYNEAAVNANPAGIAAQNPTLISRFRVTPVPLASCPGDANGDGSVNMLDLSAVIGTFGQTGPALIGDANLDGVINFADLALVLANLGINCN